MSTEAMKLALEKFAKVKELCDKHGSKINRKHVYGGALVEHFDVVCQALAEQPAQRTWVGLTDDEKRRVCRVGPVYAPDGVVTRNPLEYRKELQGVALMAVRQAEAQLKEKNT